MDRSGFLRLGGEDPMEWSLEMTSGLQFKGEILLGDLENLLSDAPPPEPPLSGDYYIVNEAGEVDEKMWNIGDWAIYNGTEYLKIDNTGKVIDFNGRRGIIESCPNPDCPNIYDYSWKMLDLTNSKLEDLSDVDQPTNENAPNGGVFHILKRINNRWTLAEDNSGVTPGEEVDAASIEDGEILNLHVGNFISIEQIQNLRNDLDSLLNQTGGDLSGTIDFNQNNLIGVNLINGNDFGKVINYSFNSQSFLDSKENNLNLNGNTSSVILNINSVKSALDLTTSNIPEGVTNLYFTEDRVYNALGAPGGSGNFNGANNAINYEVPNPDTISTAFEKLNDQIENAGDLPPNSVDGNAITEGTVTKEKLSQASGAGQSIIFYNSEWNYSSISGLNLKSDWNLNGEMLPLRMHLTMISSMETII